MWFLDGMLPILATLVVFSVVAVLGVAIIIASIKKRKMEIDAYKTAIEKGLPVPELKVTKSPVSTLKAALVWIAIGIGFGLLMIAEGDASGLAFSSIPILIGVALMISYYIEKKEREKEKSESS